MSEQNKATLIKANAAITESDNEGFLSYCADDIEWTLVGDKTIKGKQALREYMATAYVEPPEFTVTDLIAEGDLLVALGSITMKNEDGEAITYSYSDVWRFRDGKMIELQAFVIKTAGT
jgi:ketosteroid isomerase-like protein